MRTLNQADLKIENRRRIIKAILTGAPLSRTELSQQTGLSKMSVSNVVSDLIADGIVRETDKVKTPYGRSPVNLEICPDGRRFIGLYISRDALTAGLCDMTGHMVQTCHIPLAEETNDTLMDKLCGVIDTLMTVKGPTPAAIGIASIGPLDRRSGVILTPPNFYHVHNLPVVTLLTGRYGLPVFLDNDTNACAVAEQYFGQARHQSNVIFLGVSNGIGAGVIVGGRLCSGTNGLAGEVGHITVDVNGPRCSCGNTGCLELYASIRQDCSGLSDAEKEAEAARICPYLAAGCVTLINLFDPEVIYLGYRFTQLGQAALIRLRQEIDARYLGRQFSPVAIAPATFGDNEPLFGAVSLCVDRMAL